MNKLERLKGLGTDDAAATKTDMIKLAKEFSAIANANGYGVDGCRTVCETSITIGPDGKPVAQVVCRLVCDL
jgi:hypothetical protein